MDETTTPFAVNFYGSHPDEDNDDCWYGEDFATVEEARRALLAEVTDTSGVKAYEVAFIVLDGPGVHEIRENPSFDAARVERDRIEFEHTIAAERKYQALMAYGCGYYD